MTSTAEEPDSEFLQVFEPGMLNLQIESVQALMVLEFS